MKSNNLWEDGNGYVDKNMVFKVITVYSDEHPPINIKTLTLDELVDMFLNIKVDYEIKIQYFLNNEKNIKSEIEKLRNSDYKKRRRYNI